jgi:molybdopterin converting factor small subunit
MKTSTNDDVESNISNFSKLNIKVYYFAKVKEILNKKSDEILVDSEISIKEIFNAIIAANSNCNKIEIEMALSNSLLSLNDEYLGDKNESLVIKLKKGDELSVIPPISAG